MTFFMDFLTNKKNRKSRLYLCWLAATNSINKLRKKDVESFDTVTACNEIKELLNGSLNDCINLRLAAQLSFGATKIHKKQLEFLEEDCRELYRNILVDKVPHSQKSRASSPDHPGYTEQDIIDMFPKNKKDNNQITEIDIPRASDFGEMSFYTNSIQDPLDIHTGPAAFEEITALAIMEDAFILPNERPRWIDQVTPNVIQTPSLKRKSHKPHNETPTKKRPDKNRNEIPVTPSRSITGIPTELASPSEAAKSPMSSHGPRTRRSLLSDFNDKVADIPTEEAVQPNVFSEVDDGVNLLGDPQPLADRFSPPTVEIIPPIQVQDNLPEVQEPVQADLQEEEQSVATTGKGLLQSSDIPTPHRRKRNKKFRVFDTEKQIKLDFDHITTRDLGNVLVNQTFKVSVKELLSLPSTGLKIIDNLCNKPRSIWGKALIEEYNIAVEEILEISVQRDPSFKRPSDLRETHSSKSLSTTAFPRHSEPGSSEHQSVDKTLNIDQDNRQNLPHIFQIQIPEKIPSLPQLSKERHPTTTVPEPFLEPQPAFDEPEFMREPEYQEQGMPKDHRRTIVNNNSHNTDQYSSGDQTLPRLSSISTVDDMRKLIERMWEVIEHELQDQTMELALKEVFPPEETLRDQIIEYVLILFELEQQSFLRLKQDEPYGPVSIIKVDPNDSII